MNVNEFITQNSNNFIIKYKNKLYGFNTKSIKKIHLFTFNNKILYFNIGAFFNKNFLIDFKQFSGFLKQNKKIIEIRNIKSKGNKYILHDSFYDPCKLIKSKLYENINNFLIDKTFTGDKFSINKEIKKLDKAFIETAIRNEDNTFYCSINNTKLKNIGDEVYIKHFIKCSKSNVKKTYKVIFNLPYLPLNTTEKHILLPRNILLQVISKDKEYILLAKEKKINQFKATKEFSIKADVYMIESYNLSLVTDKKLSILTKQYLVGAGGTPLITAAKIILDTRPVVSHRSPSRVSVSHRPQSGVKEKLLLMLKKQEEEEEKRREEEAEEEEEEEEEVEEAEEEEEEEEEVEEAEEEEEEEEYAKKEADAKARKDAEEARNRGYANLQRHRTDNWLPLQKAKNKAEAKAKKEEEEEEERERERYRQREKWQRYKIGEVAEAVDSKRVANNRFPVQHTPRNTGTNDEFTDLEMLIKQEERKERYDKREREREERKPQEEKARNRAYAELSIARNKWLALKQREKDESEEERNRRIESEREEYKELESERKSEREIQRARQVAENVSLQPRKTKPTYSNVKIITSTHDLHPHPPSNPDNDRFTRPHRHSHLLPKTVISGGLNKSKTPKKEILGKIRCIYKVPGSRKEHVKHNGQLISVSDYKKLMKQR